MAEVARIVAVTRRIIELVEAPIGESSETQSELASLGYELALLVAPLVDDGHTP